MEWIIDSISDGIVKCEIDENNFFNIDKKFLPQNISEGDVIALAVSKEKTNYRQSEIKTLMNELFKD